MAKLLVIQSKAECPKCSQKSWVDTCPDDPARDFMWRCEHCGFMARSNVWAMEIAAQQTTQEQG